MSSRHKEVRYEVLEPRGSIGKVQQQPCKHLDLLQGEGLAPSVPRRGEQFVDFFQEICWRFDSHLAGVNDEPQHFISVVYDHLKQFIPSDGILAYCQVGFPPQNKQGFYASC